MISDMDLKYNFNVDEIGLFVRCTPDNTMTFKGESCRGGKSANPRCFKNVKSKPVEYGANKKAWMIRKHT
ncbi:hypothetical protein PR048_007045 [Dryococelus australis]|uniref:Uncharacterized protein n=1 Tax=Dryococelus australis TaxID=614101 RepID=A0ABQ9ICJ1_9NEOP|nr:hypothetical protein PR048_007045 [Dryococelus australis]